MKVLVGTANPGKVEAVKQAFELYYEGVEVQGVSVGSGVAEQPVDKDTIIGAENRVRNLVEYSKTNSIDADYFVAVESGLMDIYGKYCIMNVGFIKNSKNEESFGFSSAYPVPDNKIEAIKKTNLGVVMDELFNIQHDAKKPKILGAIHSLTNGMISRIDLTKEAVIMALTKFLHKEWQ